VVAFQLQTCAIAASRGASRSAGLTFVAVITRSMYHRARCELLAMNEALPSFAIVHGGVMCQIEKSRAGAARLA